MDTDMNITVTVHARSGGGQEVSVLFHRPDSESFSLDFTSEGMVKTWDTHTGEFSESIPVDKVRALFK